MTTCFPELARRTARVGGWPLARAAALAAVALAGAGMARAQTWEMMPLIPYIDAQQVYRADFLLGDTPADDSLVIVRSEGAFLYNPSGAAGAAGPNGWDGRYGVWHPLCATGLCGRKYGFVTTSGAIVIGSPDVPIKRSTDRGRTWVLGHPVLAPDPMAEMTLGAFLAPDGTPGLLLGGGDSEGTTARSFGDGAPGTWEVTGRSLSYSESIGEVPPSAALPNGRIFFGVWNGIVYSDDKAMTWHPTSAYGLARYIAYSFAWRPVSGHPYGGTLYSGVMNTNPAEGGGEGRGAEVLRSDDGGLNWTLVHRFTMAEMGLPPDPNVLDVSRPVLFTTPDGAIWAGVSRTQGPRPRGGIMRSVDGGATWQRAGDGFGDAAGGGYAVNEFALARDGRLYAATSYSVWRTTASVVGAESGPAEASGLGVTVRPNPASGRVAVRLSLDGAAAARVSVVDALGREVALLLDGPLPAGETVASVETGAWPVGLYVVRASSGARQVSARLIVAR